MAFTEGEALGKWCPFTKKHCRGTKCMLFVRIVDYYRVSSKEKTESVYQCGMLSKLFLENENGND